VKTWLAALPPALIFTIWIFILAQWEYIGNQYSFMLSETRLFTTYMMIGSALATATFTLTNSLRFKYHVSFCIFILSQAGMLLAISFYPNNILMTAMAFLIGGSLF
jgi:hypothetical protein